jgi:4-hydroxy-tetrahydrodipicolinate synthase
MPLRLEGIWAPTPTPLKKNKEDIDRQAIKTLVDFLIDDGVDGLLPLGTSGEFALLSPSERRDVLDATVDQVNGRVPVVAGVSDPSPENVMHYSRDAKDAGVDAVIATPPYYFSTTNEGLYEFYKTISEGIDLPLLIYNIPDWTNVLVPVEIVSRLAEDKLVVGMKYTQYNLLNLLKFIDEVGDKIAVFTGSDAMAYTNLEFGGKGAVIGVANVAPKISSRIYDEFKLDNYKKAAEAQWQLLPAVEAIGTGKFPAGLKEAMNLIGINVGGVRSPLPDLDGNEKATVKELLGQAGLLKKEEKLKES